MVSIKNGLVGLVLAAGITLSLSNAHAQDKPGDSILASQTVESDSLKNALHTHYKDLKEKYGISDGEHALIVDGESQKAYLVCEEDSVFGVVASYDVSTGKNGFGNKKFSYTTPLGVHQIEGKNGSGAKVGTVFHRGTSTGQTAYISKKPKDDRVGLLVTRIMRLQGCESQNSNSYLRGIFIHGTNREGSIGRPDSGGCVRMRNAEIIDLYPFLDVGNYVKIVDKLN